MNEKMPRTPLSTPLSGSARETEIRIRNIMSGPKKRPPVLFLVLMFSVCIFCGNLVSCQVKEAEVPDSGSSSSQADSSDTSTPTQAIKSGLDRTPDLNRNGVSEEFKLVEEEDGNLLLEVWENGKVLFQRVGETAYPRAEFLCTLDGKDYLLRYQNWNLGGQGNYYYSYNLADFDGEFEESERSVSVDFDLNFGSPYHKDFDPEAIAALVGQVNELLPNCELLFCTSPDLLATFEEAGRLEDDLSWLDDFPDLFTRDPDKSLLENLQDFKTAMPPDWTPPAPENDPELLFDRPIEMTFSSGAGAWQTVITLHGDGTFQGDYCDADLDTHYVCQFHGRFGDIAPMSDNSWYLVLKELVLDTKYPVGREWDEGGIHYISSDPYGFNTLEGGALEPGAEFIFYYPGATGHEPGTELYGAYEFWTWWPDRHFFRSSADTLGCYGLHSLETGYGFFSDR